MIACEMGRVADALAAVRMPAQPEEYDIRAAVAEALPGATCGKPVRLLPLNRLWGVALT